MSAGDLLGHSSELPGLESRGACKPRRRRWFSAGTCANLVRQAKSRSKQKIIDQMEAAGRIEKIEIGNGLRFNFKDVHRLPHPSSPSMTTPLPTRGRRRTTSTSTSPLASTWTRASPFSAANGTDKFTLLHLMTGAPHPPAGTASITLGMPALVVLPPPAPMPRQHDLAARQGMVRRQMADLQLELERASVRSPVSAVSAASALNGHAGEIRVALEDTQWQMAWLREQEQGAWVQHLTDVLPPGHARYMRP